MRKKIAIITGASSGIGKQFALKLKDHGNYDEVWAIARNAERLAALRDELPFPVKTLSVDLTKSESIDELKKILAEEDPLISLLINCSGYGKFEAMAALTFEENVGMIDLNCRALTEMTYISLPYMEEGSEIVNIASVAAFQPIPYINVYGATKAYVLSFSRALNRELKGRGIRSFAVCPFWTKTAFFDRAVNEEKEAVVKKYAAMYEPEYIVDYAWKAMKNKNKDYCIPGLIAKMQVFMVKILPHKLIMSIWQSQQKLK
ncbi:MAG: SDR family NAD(P)-dependent oxidoreductase [Ruminococcaceae bacterium]|nr:SDR family NAD(P)-dependent oxidoreductase [Oscillospiraceae bacterium]